MHITSLVRWCSSAIEYNPLKLMHKTAEPSRGMGAYFLHSQCVFRCICKGLQVMTTVSNATMAARESNAPGRLTRSASLNWRQQSIILRSLGSTISSLMRSACGVRGSRYSNANCTQIYEQHSPTTLTYIELPPSLCLYVRTFGRDRYYADCISIIVFRTTLTRCWL